MPFLAQEHYPISTKDILSWTFDDYKHDWDAPIYISALEPQQHSVSARQAKSLVRQLASGFRALGLRKGDCVCIHSFNTVYYPLFFLGVIAAGGIFAGTNPAYTPFELAHTLRTAKVQWVFVQPEEALLDAVKKAMKDARLGDDRLIIFNPHGEKVPAGVGMQWSDLLQHGELDWVRFNDLETAKDTEAARLFSSGTTGLPKAASLSHYNFIAEHTLVYEATPRPFRARRLVALPMFHAATTPVAFTTPLRAGEAAYVLPRFDLEKWFWAHEHYQITDAVLVPPVAVMAINSPLKDKYSMRYVRIANVGAAPLDKKTQARMQAIIGSDAPLTQVWGMTETSCIATRQVHFFMSFFAYPETDTTGSVGRFLSNLDAKLVDDDGRDITDYDVRGELCVRGPTIIRGYFENEEANRRDWDSEGYFHTGDIAYCDGKTKLWYIVDRKKELIKVRANQVTPPELEGVLLEHPNIIDAAVIGVPDPLRHGSELPRAYLVRRSGDRPSEQEVHNYMRGLLASYKMLEGGIVFVDMVPKNASGKILKRVLRERAAKEMRSKL
ncbi:hypothetical protein BAUCODRAFT_84795 [Baudoinia panamericana UAMH 10762]|uniref:AMP-dependent synthetase/ligase domain-containing protein n=1 Tax=Baudoinia panamericana (strain UAMH 10762) TaxID=717646 RepID=M2N4J8_BAUPA|nr:uncharacterized protein BAUCODRAFT_84795 [Baudoinia panamericana UAMH 10762]EMC98908.1 hypothetical protein BAUCODRAFT_84795 [Baudoinia panamericana UAMH 10762]